MEEKRKSRSIPLQEYISILQLEYLSYKVRSEIFEEPFCNKYKEFCRKKKETIDSFSLKAGRPSIFNSESVRNKYIDKFFGDGFGFPDFKYRDDYQRTTTGFYDMKYYLCSGTPVIYGGEEYIVSRNLCRRNDPELKVSIQKNRNSPWMVVCVEDVMRKDYLKLL